MSRHTTTYVKAKRHRVSAAGRKAISLAQKARWAKFHRQNKHKHSNLLPSVPVNSEGRSIFQAPYNFVAIKPEIYREIIVDLREIRNNSMPVEAYLDGYYKGWNDCINFISNREQEKENARNAKTD